jgi:type III secretion protein J
MGEASWRRLGLLVLALLLAGCERPIRDGLEEGQADDIVVLLQEQGIGAKKSRADDGTWAVTAKQAGSGDVEQLLYAYDRPRGKHGSLGTAFPGGGLLPSASEERIRYQFALGEELTATLEKIDGVLSARVHVAIPEKDPKRAEPLPSTASAFVRYRSDQRVDLMKPQLRALLAAGIAGATPDHISLFMVPVFPVARDGNAAWVDSWTGLRYRSGETMKFLWLLLAPWLLALAAVVFALRRSSLPLRRWWTNARAVFVRRRRPTESWSAPSYASAPSRPAAKSTRDAGHADGEARQ